MQNTLRNIRTKFGSNWYGSSGAKNFWKKKNKKYKKKPQNKNKTKKKKKPPKKSSYCNYNMALLIKTKNCPEIDLILVNTFTHVRIRVNITVLEIYVKSYSLSVLALFLFINGSHGIKNSPHLVYAEYPKEYS